MRPFRKSFVLAGSLFLCTEFELKSTPLSHPRYNFQQNTLGSKYMVDLIKKFNKIEHFIYVSTAFVNCQVQFPDDVIMDFPEDIDVIINKLL